MKNKGFSLVELIIVVAIMAVLIGILAPTYFRYVERTKYTTDCSNIGAILDACEVMAADPDVTWGKGTANTITISIDEDGAEYTGNGPISSLESLANPDEFYLEANWGSIVISAMKDEDGHVKFTLTDSDQINEIKKYSEVLSKRFG